MKGRQRFGFLFILIGVSHLIAFTSNQANRQFYTKRQWSAGTAYILPKGRIEVGLFQPLRKGQTDRFEWSIHPIWALQIPNMRFKITHQKVYGWDMTTRHSFVYPTPLLRRLRIKGFGIQALADMDVGGIITSDPTVPEIPHMIASRNEVIVSRWLGSTTLVTAKGGIDIPIKGGKLDDRSTIDLPIVFPDLESIIMDTVSILGLIYLRY